MVSRIVNNSGVTQYRSLLLVFRQTWPTSRQTCRPVFSVDDMFAQFGRACFNNGGTHMVVIACARMFYISSISSTECIGYSDI